MQNRRDRRHGKVKCRTGETEGMERWGADRERQKAWKDERAEQERQKAWKCERQNRRDRRHGKMRGRTGETEGMEMWGAEQERQKAWKDEGQNRRDRRHGKMRGRTGEIEGMERWGAEQERQKAWKDERAENRLETEIEGGNKPKKAETQEISTNEGQNRRYTENWSENQGLSRHRDEYQETAGHLVPGQRVVQLDSSK